jgi:short-subunit dehydrogenase
MPVSDIDIAKAKALFDLNVWSYITVTQAFPPLLLKAPGMIVNNTSISSVAPTPFSSVYHASKAAAAMFSDHQRIELAPFGIKVVDLKTGCVKSNFHSNRYDESRLPEGSIYEPHESASRARHPRRAFCGAHGSGCVGGAGGVGSLTEEPAGAGVAWHGSGMDLV